MLTEKGKTMKTARIEYRPYSAYPWRVVTSGGRHREYFTMRFEAEDWAEDNNYRIIV